MSNTIGSILKQARLATHLTQKAVAQGICSQSMISAIEHDQYLPNANLLLQLCQRLSIDITQLSLAINYQISFNSNFNQQLEKLCNQHKYNELLQFLLADSTIQQIVTASQTQAYYYYLGVAQWQTMTSFVAAKRSLKLSLAQTSKTHPNTLTRLAWISLGLMEPKLAHNLIKKTFQNLNQVAYEDNQNILFYLAAQIKHRVGDDSAAIIWLQKGIKFTTQHNSHYLLANFYYLLAQITQSKVALQRQQAFTELFNEPIYYK